MNEITLLHLGLQGLVLTAVGWITLRFLVKDARHRAWTAALSLLACTLLPPLLLIFPASVAATSARLESSGSPLSPRGDWRIRLAEAPVSAALATEPATPLHLPRSIPWQNLLAGAWITGSTLLLLTGALRLHRSLRWRRSLRPPTESERQAIAPDLCQTALLVSDQPISPCLAGLFRPVIVVPATAFTSWTPDHWRWMLAHENEHQRGGDHLIAPLGTLAKILWWWNPFARSLASHWSVAREEVCDAAALSPASQSTDPSAYARFLVDLAASQPAASLAALAMAASRPARRLKQRITALLEHRPVAPRLHPAFPILVLFTLTLASFGVRSVGVEAAPIPQKAPQTANRKTQVVFTLPPYFDGAADPKAWFTQLGVPFPEGSTAIFNRTTSQLLVRHTPEGLKQISEWLTKWQAGFDINNPKQVYLSTKWVELPTSLENQIPLIGNLNAFGPILTDPQFQVVIRALSQVKGADLLSAPNVTAKSGQRATVEVLREVQGEPSAKPDFAGVRSDMTATIKEDGYQVEVSISADMGVAFQDGKRLKDWNTKNASPMKVIHHRASKTAMLNDGETLLLPIGDAEPDRKVVLFVTASLIRPIGKKISPDQLRQLATDPANAPPHQPVAGTPKKPIRIVVKLLEEKGAEALKAVLPVTQPEALPNPSGTSAIAPPPVVPPPGTLALGGVLTSNQFATLVTALQRGNKVQVTDVPVERVITGEATFARINAEQVLQVNPTIGAENLTIDLNLQLLKQGEQPGMTTAVTIWSGQTVILSGVIAVDESGKPTHSRAICITAEIEGADENQ